jgi:hypothetical protein
MFKIIKGIEVKNMNPQAHLVRFIRGYYFYPNNKVLPGTIGLVHKRYAHEVTVTVRLENDIKVKVSRSLIEFQL